MRVVVKYPGERWRMVNLTGGEQSIKRLAHGEYVIWEIADGIGMVCNENGYSLGLPFAGTFRKHRLYGNLVIVGVKDGDFTDLPKEASDKIVGFMVPAV